ncbi:MAG: type II toxin-antitoxin system VapC family toxin [Candidatus Anammoximicrobium sp.]|mgnify:FL=1|nr:type II toxin-antitoxin system VapC family toxin [Candidatus Anammoximicrobium sp.]
MASVYLETSVIGYLASRPGTDIIFAANQLMTLEWWNDQRSRFELFASQAVVDECSAGDPTAAKERLVFLNGIPVLAINAATQNLAQELIRRVGLPAKAAVDALHIAIAALNRIDYLLTWNCKHIANPAFRRKIEDVLNDAGLRPPVICTPQEILNV